MSEHKTLLQKFLEFNRSKCLAGKKKRALLAVSGGMDSAVMCHLFSKAGFPFAVAHCNFSLRGEESEGDAQFVQSLATQYVVPFYMRKFDTQQYALEKKISIQMAARELRYEWFEEMRGKEGFHLIATAHHLNDNIETIIYNLVKGTGVRGLRGIPLRKGAVIRPLLFASREEIEGYQKEHQLHYREDSSNQSDKYARNEIRHRVIPVLKDLNPSLEHTFAGKADLFTELERIYDKEVKKTEKQLFLPRGGDIYIPIAKLKVTQHISNTLYEYLKEYDFTPAQVEDILSNLHSIPGAQFFTAKARIIKDRRFFILTQLPEKDFTAKLINENDTLVSLGEHNLELSTVSNENLKILPSPDYAFIEKSKLEFPLIVRHWKAGDYFYPFGMNMKKKKLKKFFTDQKIPLNQKEAIWVIESNKKMVWVAGHRIDERFKVLPTTREVLKMQLKKDALTH